MALVVNCPSCNVRMTLADDRAGTRFPCGRCGAPITAPRPAPAPPPPRATAPAPPPRPAPEPPPADAPAPGVWSDPRVLLGTVAVVVMLLGGGVYGLGAALKKPTQVVKLAAAWAPAPPPPAPPTPKTRPTRARRLPTLAPTPEPVAVAPKQPEAPPEPQTPAFAEVPVGQGQPRAMKLAVNGTGSDDVGTVIKSLGKGYSFTFLHPADTETEARLGQFDVVFLNCGGPVGEPVRTAAALRGFVAGGKSLYASDLQYGMVSQAFPEAVDNAARASGSTGLLKAEVVDEGLRGLLGKTIDLNFNAGGWQAAAFRTPDSVTYLRSATNRIGVPAGAPLLVKFGHGNGQVIFTSFHNSAIASATAKKLLQHLVFSAVVAESEARIRRVLSRDRFVVKTADVLNAPLAGAVLKKTIDVPTVGTIRVGVAFNNEKAKVELVLEGPGGLRYTGTGTDAFLAEVRYAPPGEWTLTVTARETPYPNFPLALLTTEPKPR